MKVVVKKWGNSAAVRIPAVLMRAMQLSLDAVVDVREEGGRIVIEPVLTKAYRLDRAGSRHHSSKSALGRRFR